MAVTIIGLVGPPKAGKGEICEYLRNHLKASIYSVSALIGLTLDLWAIPKERDNYSRMIRLIITEFGYQPVWHGRKEICQGCR